MKTPSDAIIEKFGGLTALSKALGHSHPTTVQGWKKRGMIPLRQWDNVIRAAKVHGIKISYADFTRKAEAA